MDSPAAAAAAAAEKSQFPDFYFCSVIPAPSFSFPLFSVVKFPHLDLLSFLIT